MILPLAISPKNFHKSHEHKSIITANVAATVDSSIKFQTQSTEMYLVHSCFSRDHSEITQTWNCHPAGKSVATLYV